jgi:hypothetical protein
VPSLALAGAAIAGGVVAVSLWTPTPPADAPRGTEAAASPTDVWGPLAVAEPVDGIGEALATGMLRINDDCVLIELGAGATALLVWPADRTEWNSTESAVTLRNLDGSQVTLGDGDRVALGGGGDSVQEGLGDVEWVAPPAAACQFDARWFVGEYVN